MTQETEMTAPQSNARLIAELQAATIAIRMFGLSRLPEVMARAMPETLADAMLAERNRTTKGEDRNG